MRKYSLKIVLILCFLSAYSKCNDKVSFTVKSIDSPSCMNITGDFYFRIYGDFSSEDNIEDSLTIYLNSPSNSKAKCNPLISSGSTRASFSCSINVCVYPLNKVSILLSTKQPTSSRYEFPNWEEFFGSDEGKTNLIQKDAECIPFERNIFIPSSLKSVGCNREYNIFEINGKWKNDDYGKLPINPSYQIALLNDEKDVIDCRYDINNNKDQFKCEFKGEGEIKFGKSYFKSTFDVFRLEENDLSINVKKCESTFFKSSFYMMGILILFLLI